MNRVGIGYDVHPLVEGRKLFLGGIELAHDKGLEGHSDADVLVHALADAILGALGAALGISPERVNLKATTNEKLGFAGRGEGIAAMAVACVTLPD